MPIDYVIDRDRGRIYSVAHGLVTFADVTRHIEAQAREDALELPELVDAQDATTNLTPDQVRQLAHRTQAIMKTLPLGPTAIVAENSYVFGMARMYSILAESAGAPVAVFHDIDEASKWLENWKL